MSAMRCAASLPSHPSINRQFSANGRAACSCNSKQQDDEPVPLVRQVYEHYGGTANANAAWWSKKKTTAGQLLPALRVCHLHSHGVPLS